MKMLLWRCLVLIMFSTDLAVACNPLVFVNDIQVVEGNSGTTNAAFVISLSEPCEELFWVSFGTYELGSYSPILIDYSGVNQYPATSGRDFIPTNGAIAFKPGETNKIVYVQVIGDEINEANEVFGFGTSPGGRVGRCTIWDDDVLEISLSNPVVLEGQGRSNLVTFFMSTSRETEQYSSGEFSTHDGTAMANSDYQGTGGPWSFGPGPAQTKIFGQFQVFGDTNNEDDETFSVTGWFWRGGNGVIVRPGICTILNDDFFLKMENAPSNHLRLTLEGALGATHVLEWSTNFTDWTAFSTNILGPERKVTLELTNGPFRFYRALRDLSILSNEPPTTSEAGVVGSRITSPF
ncbi:MAG: hypothetical protein M3Y82_13200 [Verrucomicrobiota bacterium]|nr:hypothetical protein [Verrucomicrobiota bacterium]